MSPVMKRYFRWLLVAWAALAGSGLVLAVVTFAGWLSGTSREGPTYLALFLVHLVLGLLVVAPSMIVLGGHALRGWLHRNRKAARIGWIVLGLVAAVVISGLVLTRVEGLPAVKDPLLRSILYWVHVASPVLAVWWYTMHRLAARRVRWRAAAAWAAVSTVVLVFLGVTIGREQPTPSVDVSPAFFPALVRTTGGGEMTPRVLANDTYCKSCHSDIHERWSASVHRFSSFNNPPYAFSVLRTREAGIDKARFCAGCHDPVPLLTGRFDDPGFDHRTDATASVGITCTVCHSITAVGSVRGNADFVIEAPEHYPFTFSESKALQWVNRQLLLAKPELHKKTFLKPIHSSPELCSACHKVHIPKQVNEYKWLRGQNHYDSFLLSGVSGHGAASFYYPDRAHEGCTGCHMPTHPSRDFGSFRSGDSPSLVVHDHLFPAANTAVPVLAGLPNARSIVEEHQRFLQNRVVRLDVFAVRHGGDIDGRFLGPIGQLPVVLQPGEEYLLEVVIRTLSIGHHLTQGTSDSNQLWLDVQLEAGDRIIGRSGAMDADGVVDPWAHFVNAYVVDREGRRIDRRNAEDILAPLYDNQIPPGAADVVHYRFRAPQTPVEQIAVAVALKYRKFDTTYMRHVYGGEYRNRLPVTTLAEDRVVLPLAGSASAETGREPPAPLWERWNDYGIGLLRQGELRQAEQAFRAVERLGSVEGPLNLARVYLAEGRVTEDAPAALARAGAMAPPANAWSLLWFGGLVNLQNGRLAEAEASFRRIVGGRFAQAADRGFDFSEDYRVLNELGRTVYLQALRERGTARKARRQARMGEATEWFERVLALDPENLAAHYGLQRIAVDLGDSERARRHGDAVERYRLDDNARDRAMATARRRDPAADRAAEDVVIHDLHRENIDETVESVR